MPGRVGLCTDFQEIKGMSDFTIKNVAQMREVIGESFPGLEEKNMDHVDHFARDFISKSPFIVLSTSDESGRMDASPKGDAPGFVELADERTLLIPDRFGNKLAYGHRNILANSRIGLLFMIPNTSETLRVNGKAELTRDPELLERLQARNQPALLVIRVFVEECFFHCGKAMIRSNLWKPENWGEKHRVSFGEMYAERKKVDSSVAAQIDASIKLDYKERL